MPPYTPEQILEQAWRLALAAGLGEEGARVLLAVLRTEGGLAGAGVPAAVNLAPMPGLTMPQVPVPLAEVVHGR